MYEMNVLEWELGMAASSTLVNSQHQHSLTVLSAFGGRRTDDGGRGTIKIDDMLMRRKEKLLKEKRLPN
jgi:hypothetical protein